MSIQLKGAESSNWSWSRYEAYLRCGKAYELRRVVRAPQVPSWYAVAGIALHEVTEEIDRLEFLMGENVTTEDDAVAMMHAKLDVLIAETTAKSGLDQAKWLTAGRPKQQVDHWRATLPLMVQRYLAWRKDTPWQWAEWGGEPAIELKLEIELGGLPFIAVLDRGVILPNDSLGILDIKSGKKPDSVLQLGAYATALEIAGHERPKFGLYWLGKTGEHTAPVPLERYTKDFYDQIFGEAAEGVRRGVFPPSPGDACRMCSVADACFTTDGQLSHLYDRLDPNYKPNVKESA